MKKEKIEDVIRKIATVRTKKGYTYENMAHELSITPAAYRKTETGETKLTVERLFRISEILNVPLTDLLEIGNNDIFQQTNNETATGCYQQKIENFFQENKEVYEKLLKSKDEQIALLKNLLEKK
jgi:transcriptional regulator with XRE-family HTH domain